MIEHQLLGAGLGAIIGAVLALTGAGGGILAVPLLVFGLGLSMVEAAPVGLLAVGMAAAVGAVLGLRQGLVRYRAALFIALIGVAAAPFGLMLAHRLPNTPLQLVFAGVLVYACLRIWRKAAKDLRGEANDAHRYIEPCVLNPLQGRLRWTLPCARALAFTGALSGLLSGLLGVGGGFLIVPAFRKFSDVRIHAVVSTSLMVVALVSLGTLGNLMRQGVSLSTDGVLFIVATLVGMIAGRVISPHVSAQLLQQGFAVLCALVSVLMFAKVLMFNL